MNPVNNRSSQPGLQAVSLSENYDVSRAWGLRAESIVRGGVDAVTALRISATAASVTKSACSHVSPADRLSGFNAGFRRYYSRFPVQLRSHYHPKAFDSLKIPADIFHHFDCKQNIFVYIQNVFVCIQNDFVDMQNVFVDIQNDFVYTQNVFVDRQNVFVDMQNDFVDIQNVFVDIQNVFVYTQNDFVYRQNVFVYEQNVFVYEQNVFVYIQNVFAGDKISMSPGKDAVSPSELNRRLSLCRNR
jgi:hypothetical protein